MRISDWSSDVCSSDLQVDRDAEQDEQAADRDHRQGANALDDVAGHEGRGVHAHHMPLDHEGGSLEGVRAGDHGERGGHHDEVHRPVGRSEEHTSELQSLMRNSYAVFCLKKKNKITHTSHATTHKKNTKTHNNNESIE